MSADKMIVLTLRDGTTAKETSEVASLVHTAIKTQLGFTAIQSVQVRDFEPLVKEKDNESK